MYDVLYGRLCLRVLHIMRRCREELCLKMAISFYLPLVCAGNCAI